MAKKKTRMEINPDIPSIRTDADVLSTGVLTIASMLGMMIWAIVVSKSDMHEYSGVHHTLFTLCMINIVVCIAMRRTLFSTAVIFYTALQGRGRVYRGDIGSLLHLISIMLVPIAILFILDISFMKSYGVRISVTATVMIGLGIIEYVKGRLYKRAKSN